MKINPSHLAGVQTYKKQSSPTKPTQNGRIKEDTIQISSTTKEMHTKFEVERQARIKELKRQIENGEYKVDSSAVAEKMIAFWSGKSEEENND